MTSEPDHSLFNELFIEYLQTFFFKHPDEKMSTIFIMNSMPYFYKDDRMVAAGIHILLMRKAIISVGVHPDVKVDSESRDMWIASKDKILGIEEDKKTERDSKKADLKVKQLTVRNFYIPYAVSGAALIVAILSVSVSYLNYSKPNSSNKQSTHISLQIPVTQNKMDTLIRKDSISLQLLIEKRDSLGK